jgi:two-component system, chemotaxis family, sensor kinase CheA
MDDLLVEFLTECSENIQELDTDLVELERCPGDRELLGRIFRLVHTIKGTCGFLGLPRLERVAHAAENLLGLVREGERAADPEVVTAVLAAVDRIKLILAGLSETQAEPEGDDGELMALLARLVEGDADPAVAPDLEAIPAADTDTAEPVAAPEAPATEIVPAAGSADRPAAEPAGGSKGEALGTQTLRVQVDLLERLMTLVSELVLTRNQLLQLLRTRDESVFKAPLHRLSQITSELQEGVMKTRMQPIGNAWNKLPRLVRDLAQDLGKPIELKMLGAETELDRQVLELIRDPLTHMVRNSADHGLEMPDERRRLGKPEVGTITLEARHEGGHIVIRMDDDGRGLDIDRIRAKALQQGLCTQHEAETLGAQQIAQLIFKAGFSTAETITAVSGRGVGMDVVRSNIERIGGTIELRTERGQGTSFTVRIPLTLAIVSSLIVASGGERFALPQLGVVELVRAGTRSEHRLETVDGARLLRLREQLLPLLSLAQVLGLEPVKAESDDVYVVVAQAGSLVYGLIVDQVFDTEEVVVKPMAPILQAMRCYSGNTILGDGSVVMILDLKELATSIERTASDRLLDGRDQRPRGEDRAALLLFEAGGARKGVPLALITRLEEVAPEAIEWAGGLPVTQYRGGLMPLTTLDGAPPDCSRRRPVIVFSDSGRTLGLVVDRIIDTVEVAVNVALAPRDRTSLGDAIIDGRATELLDVGELVTRTFGGWFNDRRSEQPFGGGGSDASTRALLVDDSPFIRGLLVPILAAEGYHVTAVASADEAMELEREGQLFEVIISDIEMPGMNGFDFAARIRAHGPWQTTPMIALTSHGTPQDVERGRRCGFDGHVGKFDRQALLDVLAAVEAGPAIAA